ncbi:MAG: uroporphyrinogen decarboxylase family protein [Acidiferrobacterales bacterium]
MRSTMDAFLHNTAGNSSAFVPAMERLAARVGGMSYQSMSSDPAPWCSNLTKAGQLLQADALVLGFDDTLLAEACGANVQWQEDRPLITGIAVLPAVTEAINGRLETAVEALGRLIQTASNDFCCIAAMTGPVTLAALLDTTHDQAGKLKQITVEIAQALCHKRPDLLLFREGPAICENDISMPQRKAFNTLCNVARYFNIPTAIYVEGYTSKTLNSIDKLKMDFYFFGETADGTVPDPGLFLDLAQRVKGIGIALPFNDVTEALLHAEFCKTTLTGKNILFTTPGDLVRDTDLDTARAITSGLKSLC